MGARVASVFHLNADMMSIEEDSVGDANATKDVRVQGAKRLVMDFDCTLSMRHLFKTTHMSGGSWRKSALEAAASNIFPPLGDPTRPPAELPGGNDIGRTKFSLWIMGGGDRVLELKEWFAKLHQKNVQIEISSLSEVSWILKVLDHVGLLFPTTLHRPKGEKPFIARVHGLSDDYSKVLVWTPQEVDLDDVSLSRQYDDPQYPSISGWVVDAPFQEKQKWLNFMKGDAVLFVDDTADNYHGVESAVRVFNNAEYGLKKDGSGLNAEMMGEILEAF
jgi:hypothetical protein